MDFCTLGMFIIDDIYPSPTDADQTPKLSIPGGAGTYSALGARLLSPGAVSSLVGWIVDCGVDFPAKLKGDLVSWETGALFRDRPDLTTRGWNGYGANEHRDFKYLTRKIRLCEDDLSPALLRSRSFHMVCSQERCISLVEGILARRRALFPDLDAPIFIYEPSPDCAIPSQLAITLKTLQHVDVISPNHEELASLCAQSDAMGHGGFNTELVEACSRILLDAASAKNRTLSVVVRAGKQGSYTVSNAVASKSAWLPAFHTDNQSRVVDPTGGGNGFLGGFCVGLVRTGDVIEATRWGHVSASLCIEQVGIPVLARDSEGGETWNGADVRQRLEEYRGRTCKEQ